MLNKSGKKIIVIFLSIFMLFSIAYNIGVDASYNITEEEIQYYSENIDMNNITSENILEIYEQLSREYSNEEIANIIEQNKDEIVEQGISQEVITAGEELLKNTDTETLKDIVENDINIEEIKKQLQEGASADQVLTNVINETPTEKKIEIVAKLFFTNQIVKAILVVIGILFIYSTILRWIIYSKAGKHGWAAIIPIYRQIVMYKICGLSPFLMLLWFIPILGWIALFIIAIMKRFCLANSFGRGALFGFGLLILPVILQSIIAFNPNIKYEGEK